MIGTGEAGAPMKAAKNLASQDQQTGPVSYPEWAAAFQAYYNSVGRPPPGYFPPFVVSGPQLNTYLWGGQPMMPPYGTPPPYAAVYSHGGIYAHPPMPPAAHHYSQFGIPSPSGASDASMMEPAGEEMDACRGNDTVEDRSPLKPSKGSFGSPVTGKGGICEKGNSGSANGVFSQSSGESASVDSSEGSEENNSQNMPRKRSFDQISVDGGNRSTAFNSQTGVKQISAFTSSGMVISTPTTPFGGVGRDAVPPELWLQDEREVKRQRRKQSNRESARRSRLRKQAECDELGNRVDTLTMENMALRTELARLSEE